MFEHDNYFSNAFPWIAAACIVYLASYIGKRVNRSLQVRSFKKRHGCRDPPIHGTGLLGLGNLKELITTAKEKRYLQWRHDLHHEIGNTFQVNMLGMKVFRTAEPLNVQTTLALGFQDFDFGGHRNRAFAPLLGKGIFASDGALWEHARALLRPSFNREQIADTSVFEHHFVDLAARIPRDGSTVDLQPLFFALTLDTATEHLFGESVATLKEDSQSPTHTKFARDFDTALHTLAFRLRLGPLLPFVPNAEGMKACEDARKYVDRFVQIALDKHAAIERGGGEKLAKSETENCRNYVFLDELAKQTTDKEVITDQLMNILLAVRDTTAGLLSFVFYQLARRKDVWEKLKAEIDGLGGQRPSFEQVKSLKYLKYVLNETLRLYPIVPVAGREANKDTVLPLGGGPDGKSPMMVEKGEMVIFTKWTMHRLKEVYGPDAEDFVPERWETIRPGWAFVPFSGGPRICLGQQFALTEASYTIVRLLQTFSRIEARDAEPWVEGLSLTLSSWHGVKVALFEE